ncbi:flavin reductase like domain-domain-containing protein [Leucosporidium creatinivorum]|uniref:Flavin reductase like domain-domain-containing protein n=1 Tax=Leucosporidium creatinivorum TaxID=106004 RepID=A0A1Y2ERA9_9BASI|nr:flavin reductase like domain-domain-containing protein [Leucosporidium creatinivorum]
MVVSVGRQLSTATAKGGAATALRQLMRRVAQPVAVISCHLDSTTTTAAPTRLQLQPNHGATLSSLSSISLSPPLVAFSLRLPSRLATHLSQPKAPLSIHLLTSNQQHLARAFARQPPLPLPATPSPLPSSSTTPPGAEDHFPPQLFDDLHTKSLGTLRCTVLHSIPLATLGMHAEEAAKVDSEGPRSELFVARVEEVDLGPQEEGEGSLVYWEQEYRSVGGDGEKEKV